MKQSDFRYILARGKEVATGDEVMGTLYIDEYSPRESFTKLFTIDTNDEVLVDPVTVELYTGLRCSITGKRIFEGDLIQLDSPMGVTINPDAEDQVFDYYGEICMPLNMVKAGASKRLYLYDNIEALYGGSFEGFYQVGSQWDAMDWCIVGRTSIENVKLFDPTMKIADTILEQWGITVYPDNEETVANTLISKGSNVWRAIYGKDWGDRPLFGTFMRRRHILRRLKEFYDGKKGVTYGEDLHNPEYDALRAEWYCQHEKMMKEMMDMRKIVEEKQLKETEELFTKKS